MLIRHAEAARDGEACASIYAPSVLEGAVSFEERAPTGEELAVRIERISRTHPWLVADEHEQTIGYAYASPHRERAAYRWAADVTVYVAAGQRARGVGRALYTALFDLLVRQGIYVACAGITLPNEASVALHESLGFRPVGVYRNIGWKAQGWRDVSWWQLQLIEPEPGERPPEPGEPARLDQL